jgi:hypothetical protein
MRWISSRRTGSGSTAGVVLEAAIFVVHSSDYATSVQIEWIDREIAFYRKEPAFRSAGDRAAMIAFFEKARAASPSPPHFLP